MHVAHCVLVCKCATVGRRADVENSIREHTELLGRFFLSAVKCLCEGQSGGVRLEPCKLAVVSRQCQISPVDEHTIRMRLQTQPEEPGSAIHVALKIGEPYKSWKIVQTARAVCPNLHLQTTVPFAFEACCGTFLCQPRKKVLA